MSMVSDNKETTIQQYKGCFVTNYTNDDQANYLVKSPNIGGTYSAVICGPV